MRIALLTIWHDGNYGAEMQAYATVKVLKQLGNDVQMINARLADTIKPNLRGRIGETISTLGPAHKKFSDFWSKNIPTTRRYKSLQEIQQDPPEADVYMVGSDQVWNPVLVKEYINLYMLDFGRDDIKRISYASSFGRGSWRVNDLGGKAKHLLSRFHAISCRETSGLQLLEKLFGIKASTVLDPTLLFDNYAELTGNLSEKKTLVFYPLTSHQELAQYAEELGSKLGLEVVNANWRRNIYANILWDRPSIGEWIKTIAEASFVVTPSFHGLAFSIIYHRQFAVLCTNKLLANRIENLLSLLGLTERLYYTFEDMTKAEPWYHPIDYTLIEEKIQFLREKSFCFLMQALS